jgi:predicted nuclease with TOPRIM domain
MLELITQEISRLQDEFTAGENELLRLRERVAYLEITLHRIDGGITALKKVQQECKDGC